MLFRTMILVFTLAASASLGAKVTEEETFSYKLSAGGRLSVSNVNGSITVTGGSGNSVEIVAVKKADNQETLDEIKIEISNTPDAIIIEDVSADTLNGSINGSDFGLKTDKGFIGSDLNGSIGSGGARLNINTLNGSIKIRSN